MFYIKNLQIINSKRILWNHAWEEINKIISGGAKILQEYNEERREKLNRLHQQYVKVYTVNADAASARELIIGVVLPRYGGVASPFCVDNELVPLRHVAL